MTKPEKSPFVGRFGSSILKRAQIKRQAEIFEMLRMVKGIKLKASLLRETNGQGGDRLLELLEKDPKNPEMVMLIAGATDGMTYLQQAMPRLFSFIARDRSIGNEMLKKALDEALREQGKAGIAEQMFREARQDVEAALASPMKKVSTTEYIVKRSQQIRKELYGDVDCELVLVQNANRADVQDVTGVGGANRVVLIHGHGFRSSVIMTDGRISNHELKKPERMLRALILDTCGGKSYAPEETEDMGTGISEKVYGFNRTATPRDIFGTPLRKK